MTICMETEAAKKTNAGAMVIGILTLRRIISY
jgi:hypothetical protein